MGDASEVVREVGVNDFRVATEQQLFHLDHRLLGIAPGTVRVLFGWEDRKSTRLNSSHLVISYAVFCLKKKRSSHTATACTTHDAVVRVSGSLTLNLNSAIGRRNAFAYVARSIFFFNDTATTEIYTLSLHDALPISPRHRRRRQPLSRAPQHAPALCRG